MDFSPYAAVLLDLDGTVYYEEHVLPGAVELVRQLQREKRRFACLSNSTASPMRLMNRLHGMSIDLEPDQIYTAAAATCDFVLERFQGKRPRIFNLATESIAEMLSNLVDWVGGGGEPCDAVIVGAPTNPFATEERRRDALQLARRGALLVGICADRVFPSPRGIEFGAGALTSMLAYAANSQPIFCGKPQQLFFTELCTRLKVLPKDCLLIGDNLEADVAGAKQFGMRTILTLTGVTRRRDLSAFPPELQPDQVVEDLTEL